MRYLNGAYHDNLLVKMGLEKGADQADDAIWNYDARDYSGYLLASSGAYDMDWVLLMEN